MIAFAGAVLLWIALLHHPVGDYATESDFYGGYAEGARLWQELRPDPSRYAVGPGYDATLALLGLVIRDLFTAAKLISVLSAIGTLVLWRAILRRGGADLALWTVLFLAANPVFTSFGYAATTDMFAIFLQAASLHAFLAAGDRWRWARAGGFAALATLTRYNSIYLLPFGVLCAFMPTSDPAGGQRPRGRRVLELVAGFVLVAAPWVAFSLSRGVVPGAHLFAGYSTFYAVGDPTRNVQDLLPSVADSLAEVRSLGQRDPLGFAARMLGNVPDHLVNDARKLLGMPVAFTALAGLVFALAGGLARPLLPVWIAGGLLFATLVPVFHNSRYSLAIAPMYLTLAASAAAARHLAMRLGGPAGLPLKWLVVVLPLVWSLQVNVARQREIARTLPREALEAAAKLERASAPGESVMSRKGHVGFHAGRTVVPFPRVDDLTALGAYAHAREVDWLYVSWFEAILRPEFLYLIDTTAVIPGLTRVDDTIDPPSVLYRVGPEFGQTPAWFDDPHAVEIHRARANVRVLAPVEAAKSHVVLAADALDRRRPEEALGHLQFVLDYGRPDARAIRLTADALRALGRMEEAEAGYRRALLLDPRDERARAGIEWARRGIRDIDPGAPAAARADTGRARRP